MGAANSQGSNNRQSDEAVSTKPQCQWPLSGQSSKCPVEKDSLRKANGGEACFDSANMTSPADQNSSPDQPFPLKKDRMRSTIPKAGTDETWEYPSPQMFWNAMIRKGWDWKKDQLSEKDMENIINIHNANNEEAWREILKWERMLHPECDCPKLKSFKGDAKKITPRARIRHWLGYQLPFDRHDWIVDRCGQREVRYVIDYYDGGDVDPHSKLFTLLDVRPAMDTFRNIWDRAVVLYWRLKIDYLGFSPKIPSHTPQPSDE